MTVHTLDRAIGEYVGRCIEHLRDLPEAARDEMLDDIRQILTEVTAELEGEPDDLLGPPERFVAELRVAAGYDRERPVRRLGGYRFPDLLRTARRAMEHPLVRWVAGLGRDLRPAWWVGRGYLLAMVLASGFEVPPRLWWLGDLIPVPAVLDSPLLGGLATVGLIVGSVLLGRSGTHGWRRRVVAVALGAVALVVLLTVMTWAGSRYPGSPSLFSDASYEGMPVSTTVAVGENVPVATTMAFTVEDVTIHSEFGWQPVSDPNMAFEYFDMWRSRGDVAIWIDVSGTEYAIDDEAALVDVLRTLGFPSFSR